jgi:hypothetical protein
VHVFVNGFSSPDEGSSGCITFCRQVQPTKGKGAKAIKARKKVHLSLCLSDVCDGMDTSSFPLGAMVPAVVRTVEENGYICSLGVSGMSAFLPSESFHAAFGSTARALPCQILQAVVKERLRDGSSVVLDCAATAIASAGTREFHGVTVRSLLPGQLVLVCQPFPYLVFPCLVFPCLVDEKVLFIHAPALHSPWFGVCKLYCSNQLCHLRSTALLFPQATVRNVLSDGLLVSFLKFFHGVVDLFHLPTENAANWRTALKPGTRLSARILYVDPSTKQVRLSLLKNLIAYHLPTTLPTLGAVYDAATILRADKALGLLLALPTELAPTYAYAHISNVADKGAIAANLGAKFPPGKTVRAKVTGFRMMDGLATVTLKASEISSSDVSWDSLQAGHILEGSVHSVEEFGVIVQLAPAVRGLVPLMHVSEAAVPKKLQSRFKAGQPLRVRCDTILKLVAHSCYVVASLRSSATVQSLV